MNENNHIVFLFRMVPFIVLSGYFLLEGRGRLGVAGASEDVSSDALEQLREAGITTSSEDISESEDDVKELFVQRAVTASDAVHLPAALITLTLSGTSLLFAEFLQAPTGTTWNIAGLNTPVKSLVGLVTFLYVIALGGAAWMTRYAFREVHAGQYYDRKRRESEEISLSNVLSGNNQFKIWFRLAVGTFLIPVLYLLTLLLVLGIHFAF